MHICHVSHNYLATDLAEIKHGMFSQTFSYYGGAQRLVGKFPCEVVNWCTLETTLLCGALQNFYSPLNYEHVLHSLAALACLSDNKPNKQDLLPKTITTKNLSTAPGREDSHVATYPCLPRCFCVFSSTSPPSLPRDGERVRAPRGLLELLRANEARRWVWEEQKGKGLIWGPMFARGPVGVWIVPVKVARWKRGWAEARGPLGLMSRCSRSWHASAGGDAEGQPWWLDSAHHPWSEENI